MFKRLFAAFAAVALLPVAASAVVTVQVERQFLPVTGRDEIVMFEVFATNPDAGENERLNAFTIALEAPTFGGPRQPRFIIPPPDPAGGTIPFDIPTAHPYVFGAYPGNGPVDPAGLSDENTVLLSAALGGTGQEANLSDALSGFGKVNVLVPADVVPGFYPILLEPGFLSLGGAGAPRRSGCSPHSPSSPSAAAEACRDRHGRNKSTLHSPPLPRAHHSPPAADLPRARFGAGRRTTPFRRGRPAAASRFRKR